MRTLDEIRNAPVGLLTEDEINMLDPAGQAFARSWQAKRAKEAACEKHERVSTGTQDEARRGWHPGHCAKCGLDMSVDSGD